MVADLSDEQRRVLESVIGQPLEDDQVVHWAVTTADPKRIAEAKVAARARLKSTFARVRRNLDKQGISQAEWTATVDEAVQNARSRPDECESS
ncbi:MAG TPA: hypothetical protein VFW87_19055 [Pirellulales bacterium]|nr:hypothetical protein [Pirellulales bacterium]